MKKQNIETICVQEGYKPENGEPRILPIYQSTTYKFDSADHLGKLFDLEVPGHMYSRISNPTVDCVEKKLAAMEGGVGALCTSSGQAANMTAVMNIAECGDNIIAMSSIYGGTINLFAVTLKRFGVEVRFVSPEMTDEEIEPLFDEKTKAFFGETIANPALKVFDIERYAKLAHAHQIPLIVDNTFATPILCRPITFGADIVVHSTTKYMDGHASVIGGVVVDGGTFDWEASGKFPGLTEPDESYHGVIYTKQFGNEAYINKARCQLMRDLGINPQPLAMFILNLGLESLAVRMERHCENAMQVAEYLEKHEKVSWVNYPKLPGSDQYALAEKYLPKGCCGVISFGLKGGRAAAMKFMDSLKLAQIVVHVADARTSVLHPASTTHRQLTDEQLEESGVKPEMVRFSVGIEHISDILADLDQAFAQI